MKAGSFTWASNPSDGYNVEYNIKPKDANKDGKELEIVVGANCNPKEETQDYSTDINFGGSGNDQAKSYSTLSLRVNSDMDAGGAFSEVVSVKNDDKLYNLGVKGEFDLSKGLHDVFGVFTASGFSWGSLWLRNNFSSQIFGFGSSMKKGKNDYSCEALYDYNQKSKQGLGGLPVFLRLGVVTPIGKDCVLNQNMRLGK